RLERTVQLSPEVSQLLQRLTRQRQITLSTLMHGMWALLLSRYTDQSDVVFGTTVSGRPADVAGVEDMVGLFINTLPVRVQVSPDELLLPWLQKLQEHLSELRQYEYSPLVQVQNWSEVPRGVSLFESLLVFENYPLRPLTQGDEGQTPLRLLGSSSLEQSNYPLSLIVLPGTSLACKILYDRGRFSSQMIEDMTRHLQTLLEAVAQQPEQLVATLSLLTASEREQLLHRWNPRPQEPQEPCCIHQLFEDQVQRAPDAIALAFEDHLLTFGELNRRANQLAHALQELGVGPEALVAVCLERSVELVIAIMGILKAGGAYVPLDPQAPAARLRWQLGDTAASLLLTQQRFQPRVPHGLCKVVVLEEQWAQMAHRSGQQPGVEVHEHHLAYVIYTSGSTGMPKGVQISHHNLVHSTRARMLGYEQTVQRFLWLSPYFFDSSVAGLFWTLCQGGLLLIVPEGSQQEPHTLIRLLQQWQISHLLALPSLYGLLLGEGEPQALASLQAVMVAGEVCPSALLQRQRELEGGATFSNEYGPTEASVWATVYQQPQQEAVPERVPIGRPIAGMQVYVRDQFRQPVPIRVQGE